MNGVRDDAQAIAAELGLGDAELARRKAFLEFGPADIALLAAVRTLLQGDSDTFADEFYEHLLAFPELRDLLPDEETVARLRHAQSAYFTRLTGGGYDAAYVRDRLTVGLVHQRIGLAPKWYIGAYRKYLSGMVRLLARTLRGDPDRFLASLDAILKIVCLDMSLALDTYSHADQRSAVQYQNYLHQVIEGMPAGLIVVSGEGRVLSMNTAMWRALGGSDDDIGPFPLIGEVIASPELEARMADTLANGKPHDHVLVTTDGQADGPRYFEFNIRRTRQGEGDLLLLIGQDVTFQRKARLRLQHSEEFFRLAFSQAAVGIALMSREGRLLRVNRKLTDILGYTELELVQRYFHQITHPDDLALDEEMLALLLAGEIAEYQRDKRYLRKAGLPVWVNASVSAMQDASGAQRLIVVVNDISRQKAAEEALLRMVNHDALTGLPNRVLLQDRLEQAIAHAERSRRMVAVLFVDLDRFKHVNDSLGHDAGDELIVELARRLSSCLRDSDTVARQGGDEFVVVLPDLGGADDAGAVAQKVLDTLFQPLVLRGQELFPSGSIGIAIYPRDGDDSQGLLKCADSAMYRAKAGGGNIFRFYDSGMGQRAYQHLRMEGALQRALLRREFVLHYQPMVDIATGALVGLEALVRWQPPGQPMVPPSDFIPLAEETGLIAPIGEWVLATAMAQQVTWCKQGLAPLRISVNLSARQFHGQDVAQVVARLIEDTGCDPDWLALEITESVLMENPEAAAAALGQLAAMGVKLAIDDFGTGYSSLASLKRFPINSLKIDRTFVADIATDPDDAAIVGAVIALAHSMSLSVVAEGVETVDQVKFLRARGCDQMQGYWISRPVDAHAIEKMLAAPAGSRAAG